MTPTLESPITEANAAPASSSSAAASSRLARITASSLRKKRLDVAVYASSLQCPWNRVLLFYLRPGQSLTRIYQSLRWSREMVWRRKKNGLRVEDVVKLADVVRADRTEFFLHLCRELGLKQPRQEPLPPPELLRPVPRGRPPKDASEPQRS